MPITISTLEALKFSAFLVYKGLGKNGKPLRPTRIDTSQVKYITMPDSSVAVLFYSPDSTIMFIHPNEKHGYFVNTDFDLLKKLSEYDYPDAKILLRKKIIEATLRDLKNASK